MRNGVSVGSKITKFTVVTIVGTIDQRGFQRSVKLEGANKTRPDFIACMGPLGLCKSTRNPAQHLDSADSTKGNRSMTGIPAYMKTPLRGSLFSGNDNDAISAPGASNMRASHFR